MAGIYLHIPFCVKKCNYCDFISFPCTGGVPEEYVDALVREIDLVARNGEYPASFETVFFGGGTPSLLSGSQMRRIMDALRRNFSIKSNAECSMECNPGTASRENLAEYYDAGINRLSIGLQSSCDDLLKSIGRIHTYSQFEETLRFAREAGFFNINVDVMHGLPGQTPERYLLTLEAVCDFAVTHISSYALILEEHTPLYFSVKDKEIVLPDEDAVADMQDAGIDYLESRGYRRYEISNFARDGYECRHNLNYWLNGEYLGFGVAAHSALKLKSWTRFANLDTVESYLGSLKKGNRPTAETIRLQSTDEMFETVMLGLRLINGLDREAFTARFGVDITEAYPVAMDALRKRKWIVETKERIALNKKGLDLQNEALQFFL